MATKASAGGTAGLVDDELAYVALWGLGPGGSGVPVLVVDGGRDHMVSAARGRWLANRVPLGELWLGPDDGHTNRPSGSSRRK